jgi:hypothetical protein
MNFDDEEVLIESDHDSNEKTPLPRLEDAWDDFQNGSDVNKCNAVIENPDNVRINYNDQESETANEYIKSLLAGMHEHQQEA